MGLNLFDEIEYRRDNSQLGQWSSLLCTIAICGILGTPLLQITSNWKVAKIGIPIGAAAAVAGEIVERARLRKLAILRRSEAMANQSQALHFAHLLSPKQSLKIGGSPSEPAIKPGNLYQWNQFKEEAAAALIVGPQGAGKDCVAKYLAAQFLPCQILVLDPHNQRNPWGDLPVIDELDAIVQQMKLLREELEERIQDGKEGESDRPPLIIFINEWLVIKDYCQRLKSKAADEFLSDFLPQCRKYRLVPILLVQAENVDAILPANKGGLKSAFLIIRLGEAAKSYAINLPDAEVRETTLKNPGYPCLVNRKVAIHPTHGHHQQFKINGMPPSNLVPLASLPLSIPSVLPVTSTSTSISEVEVTRKSLEALYSKNFPTSTSEGSSPEVSLQVLREVREALEVGKSHSWIIENILKYKGRKFAEGKLLLERLLREFD